MQRKATNFAAPIGGVDLALNASLAAAFIAYVPLIAALAWRDWRALGWPPQPYGAVAVRPTSRR